MTKSSNFEPSRRHVPFTIDGQPFTTGDFSQRAQPWGRKSPRR